MKIGRLVNAIIRKIWLIIILALVGGSLAGYVSIYSSIPKYQSDTTLYFMNRINKVRLNDTDISLSRKLINAYSEIILSRTVLEPVIKDLSDNKITEDRLKRAVKINMTEDSNVISIAVIWHDPIKASEIANSISRNFISKMKEITNSDTVKILDSAQVPQYPVPDGKSRYILLGILTGIAVAFAIIYIVELNDSTIRAAGDVEEELGLQVFGIIPSNDI